MKALISDIHGNLEALRAVLEDIEQNTPLMRRKIGVPILALGGEVGSAPDLYESMRPLGSDVRGGVIAGSGHYIPEEEPEALAREISDFVNDLKA